MLGFCGTSILSIWPNDTLQNQVSESFAGSKISQIMLDKAFVSVKDISGGANIVRP